LASKINTKKDPEKWVNQNVHSFPLEKDFFFAGERLPLENIDVYERLDRELLVNSFWHSNTIQAIKLSARYFPVIEPILAKNGIPDDFKYLAVAESGLRNVTSPAGAKGIWQFMRGTGAEKGLTITSTIDERYHLEKATEAACEYLQSLKDKFGNWTLAAAAYNRGSNGISKDMKSQNATTYYDMNLNIETGRYIFRIVALKEILSEPDKFGFHIDHRYQPITDTKVVRSSAASLNLADFATENGVSYRTLKFYNPWLVSSTFSNPKKEEYEFVLPAK
jgi:Transglycosylase SLT domain.